MPLSEDEPDLPDGPDGERMRRGLDALYGHLRRGPDGSDGLGTDFLRLADFLRREFPNAVEQVTNPRLEGPIDTAICLLERLKQGIAACPDHTKEPW